MAGDTNIRERAVIVPPESDADAVVSSVVGSNGRVMHRYGPRLLVVEVSAADEAGMARSLPGSAAPAEPNSFGSATVSGLTESDRVGLRALASRESAAYAVAKQARPLQGQPWDTPGAETPGCAHVVSADIEPPRAQARDGAAAAAALSSALTGSVAVGLVIVEGPTAALQFTAEQRTKIVAETQNGLSWLGAQNPAGPIVWSWDINMVQIDVAADAQASDNESRFRDPALAALGFGPGSAGASAYAESIRTSRGTDWAYVAFFTRYAVDWFAYAYLGGPHLVMDYESDGWGPDNIDRVFAHETSHIFNAADEYAASGCDCGGAWGIYGKPNGNCETCAAGGGVACLMRANTWALCEYTPWHLGFPVNPPQLGVTNFGYVAGGWRVEKHSRLLADLTGDRRADIVGFGDGGVWVSLSNGDGTFGAPQLAVADFGYDAGGWRVEQHPRLVADVTGDGKLDIVGFGDAGVWVSLSQGGGLFAAPRLGLTNFGYQAGGWRVERHPRFLARVTNDNRRDILGFGDGGVWTAASNGDGTFAPPQLVVQDFGYVAGGWRVERHPRMTADLTGDRRADIVGFGDAGVWVALNNGNGTFGAPQLAVTDLGYVAGGWRVERHPRFVVDVSADRKADYVGFGDAGVWVSLAR